MEIGFKHSNYVRSKVEAQSFLTILLIFCESKKFSKILDFFFDFLKNFKKKFGNFLIFRDKKIFFRKQIFFFKKKFQVFFWNFYFRKNSKISSESHGSQLSNARYYDHQKSKSFQWAHWLTNFKSPFFRGIWP